MQLRLLRGRRTEAAAARAAGAADITVTVTATSHSGDIMPLVPTSDDCDSPRPRPGMIRQIHGSPPGHWRKSMQFEMRIQSVGE